MTDVKTQYETNVGQLCTFIEMFINGSYCQSKLVPLSFYTASFPFCQCNWHHNQDKKNHKKQTNCKKTAVLSFVVQ